MKDNETHGLKSHQPKGEMCIVCKKRDDNCSGLNFEAMQVIEKYKLHGESVAIVKCTEFDRMSNINNLIDVLRNTEGWNDHVVRDVMLKAADELERLSIGNDRYETARLMNPMAWQEAWQLNISTGKKFDEIIDDLKPFVRPNLEGL
jgi:hypothetical protein